MRARAERMAIAVLLLVIGAVPATAQHRGKHKSWAELAAEVVRTTTAYRDAVARALPAYEAEVREATETLQERQSLHQHGILSADYVVAAEQAYAAAQRSLDEARAAIDVADRILIEAGLQEQLMKLRPLASGAYESTATLVRFAGRARWSPKLVTALEERFRAVFGRGLPLSAVGQTAVHDRLGLDHREAVDVAVHPDSAEGRWLMQHLRDAGIPFIGVRAAIPGSATGAHVHVGAPSPRRFAR